jgi:D-alanine-D-alanine ligase-like ATP-grasp enzyme
MPLARNTLPTIAVIRGGVSRHSDSLDEGLVFLKSLSGLGYNPLDVIIDKNGSWLHRGVTTDPHAIFTKAEGYIDTTHMHDASHHDLANRMGIQNLFPQKKLLGEGDRESIYRILRQQGIPVPDTVTVRAKHPVSAEVLHTTWRTFHTPLMVRPLVRKEGIASKIVRSFKDLLDTLTTHKEKDSDAHILTYTNTPVFSIALLPHYRNENWYAPLPVQIFPKKDEIPHGELRVYHYDKGDVEERTRLKSLAIDAVNALDLHSPATVDIIHTKGRYIIINVDVNPSLRPEGRFMQSLSTTGVDVGHYAQSRLFI